MTVHLLVPVKRLAAGKSRLRGCLDEAGRRALNELFLRRTLANACSFPGGTRTLVVSDCATALRVAASFGARTLVQRSRPGLNEAVEEGIAALSRLGARRVVVLPTDLPLVRPCDVQALAGLSDDVRTAVIAPDKSGHGTNALAIPAHAGMRARFGEASLVAHCREALRAGLLPQLHRDSRIALDVDTPEDLVPWMLADDDGDARRIVAAAVQPLAASNASSAVTGA